MSTLVIINIKIKRENRQQELLIVKQFTVSSIGTAADDNTVEDVYLSS